MQKWIVLLLCLLLCCATVLSGCAVKVSANDLMARVNAAPVSGKPVDDGFIRGQMGLSLALFQASIAESPDQNVLISPLSVELALAMTANGADGQTRSEMEALLGSGLPLEDLNEYLFAYVGGLPSGGKAKLKLANSIWFRDDENRLTVEKDFLQTNADYYGAQAYKAPFDAKTLTDINNWVKTHTDGMIDSILDEIREDTVMYLLNALVFDAKWQEVYSLEAIHPGTFTNLSGDAQNADMMYSEEYKYLDDGKATGFIKPYSSGCSFAALLPKEDVDLYDYIGGLTAQSLLDTLNNAQSANVIAALPKFSCEYELRMNDVLSALGMSAAFDSSHADFSNMGHSSDGNLYIGEVLHKTYLAVDELGTKAGAVTKVEMVAESAAEPEPRFNVTLDRPFVYMILDNATNLPIFIGTVSDIP